MPGDHASRFGEVEHNVAQQRDGLGRCVGNFGDVVDDRAHVGEVPLGQRRVDEVLSILEEPIQGTGRGSGAIDDITDLDPIGSLVIDDLERRGNQSIASAGVGFVGTVHSASI